MPRIEELPIPAPEPIRARQAQAARAAPAEAARFALPAARLGRPRPARGGAGSSAARPAPSGERAAPPMPKAPPMPPLQRAPEVRSESVSEYAKRPAAPRPAPQGLDQHGRQAPVNNATEDDQLEIPAFLRRQAQLTWPSPEPCATGGLTRAARCAMKGAPQLRIDLLDFLPGHPGFEDHRQCGIGRADRPKITSFWK